MGNGLDEEVTDLQPPAVVVAVDSAADAVVETWAEHQPYAVSVELVAVASDASFVVADQETVAADHLPSDWP